MSELRFDLSLVEEAVFLRLRDSVLEAAAWHRAREAAFAVSAPREREQAFGELGRTWFARLGLDQPIRRALGACPRVAAFVPEIRVRRAVRRGEEGSELYLDPSRGGGAARLALSVRAECFLDPGALEELALRELLYAEDMLDPAFGYKPFLPDEVGEDVARRELVRDRFSVLWQARILGRLEARLRRERPAGELPPRFLRAFGAREPDEALCALHERVRSGEPATFGELVELAAGSGATCGSDAPRG